MFADEHDDESSEQQRPVVPLIVTTCSRLYKNICIYIPLKFSRHTFTPITITSELSDLRTSR